MYMIPRNTQGWRDTLNKHTTIFLAILLITTLISIGAVGCGSDKTSTTVSTKTSKASKPSTTNSIAANNTTNATVTTVAKLKADLNGAGATFPEPVYIEWVGAFQGVQPGVIINYQGVGSGAGIEQFTAQTVDFGASDAYMKDEELAAAEKARSGAKVIHIPTVFGAITLTYNLPGINDLKLDSDTLANIFLGKITKWNDSALAALNPGVNLPDSDIKTIHRSDSSGTTNAFTSYLKAVNADWAAGPGSGKEIQWTGGVGAKGNDGVATLVKQTANSIGYVELAYAVQNGMAMAEIKNKAGNFIAPTLESTSAAANLSTIPNDMKLVVSNSDIPEAYPIVTVTYLLAYDKWPDATKAEAFKAWLTWALGAEGSSIASELGYAPLPDNLKGAVQKMVDSIGS